MNSNVSSQTRAPRKKDMVAIKSSSVTDKDRLKFGLFLAISFHLLLMLGIRFVLPQNEPSEIPLSLDVTLVQTESLNPPEKADFIGQQNQEGAGDAKEAERATTLLEHFKNTEGTTVTPTLELVPEQFQTAQTLELVTSFDSTKITHTSDTDDSEQHSPEQQNKPTEITPPPELLKQYNLEQSVAEKLKTRGQKVRQISAAVIESPADADYLELWRKKIERVGNLHYPEEARQQGVFGKLMLRVAIDRDGQLLDVELRQSSGHKVLDDAAINIVRLAAPFDPLPEAMLATTDILEIVRQWKFHPNNSFTQ